MNAYEKRASARNREFLESQTKTGFLTKWEIEEKNRKKSRLNAKVGQYYDEKGAEIVAAMSRPPYPEIFPQREKTPAEIQADEDAYKEGCYRAARRRTPGFNDAHK